MSEAVKNSVDLNISVSNIFSNSHFKSIIDNGDSAFMEKKLKKYQKVFGIERGECMMNVLNSFYSYLLSNYRCEYVYKNFITQKVLLGRHSLNTSTLINEFRVSSSLADIVLLNGSATVYEIKTELDSPDRLQDQLNDYHKAFSNVYLVIHESEIDKYSQLIGGSSVGLLALNKRFQLSEIKKVESNFDRLDITTMFKCLRKEEYSNIINKVFGEIPNVPNMFFFRECLELAKKIVPKEFHHLMSQELKKRKPKEKNILASNRIPKYLKNICLAIDPTRNEYDQLFSFLNQKIK